MSMMFYGNFSVFNALNFNEHEKSNLDHVHFVVLKEKGECWCNIFQKGNQQNNESN